jgi:phosphatidylglycerol lysyltransferase
MRVITEAKPAAFAYAPTLAAALALIAGAMLLASGATPSEPSRFIRLLAVEPPVLIEISHFLSSILGLVLVLLAFGLRARLDAAWTATQGVLIAAALLALSKGFNWEESAVLMGAFGVIFPFHGAFPRKARLSRMEITPGWWLSAFAVLVGVRQRRLCRRALVEGDGRRRRGAGGALLGGRGGAAAGRGGLAAAGQRGDPAGGG